MVLLREREEATEAAILSSIDNLGMRLSHRLPRCPRSDIKHSCKAMLLGDPVENGTLLGSSRNFQEMQS